MEMASPYQGQADDFDIDIDLMEDHASNMDSDMVGAEDYQNTSHPSLFHDANNDADMADEPSEGSMVDADNFADEDHDIEVQDENVTYEADMLEGDQDEDIVEAVPTIQIEDSTISNNDETQEIGQVDQVDQTVPEPTEEAIGSAQLAPEIHPEPVHLDEETKVLHHEPGPETELEQHEQEDSLELGPSAQEQAEKSTEVHAAPAGAQVDGQGQVEETDGETEHQGVKTEPHPDNQEASVTESAETPQVAETQPSSAPAVNQIADHSEPQEAEHDAAHHDQVHGTDENESLHPVKVIYQDNEICLFPPLEGDSAETFFLHDEDVAYESVSKLFSSLRDVLMDNVAYDEVLVIDIDSLGIQLTEDSTHNSKMTLHHILDIYVRLSHNDGINSPDALYLTLSSKISAHSELAGLDASANQGKGLSEVHAWDVDYEDGGNTEGTAHGADVSTNDSLSSKHQDKPLTAEGDLLNQPSDADAGQKPAASVEGHEDAVLNGQETGIGLAENEDQHENVATRESDRTEENQPAREHEKEEHEVPVAPDTDSSPTITSIPETTMQPEATSLDVNEGAWEHLEEGAHVDDDQNGQALNQEIPVTQEADEGAHNEGFEEYQDEVSHEEIEAPEPVADTDAIDLTSAQEQGTVEERSVGAEDQEEAADRSEDHASLGESESTVQNASREGGAGLEEHDLDSEDDLLGIAEDVLQTTQDDHEEQPDDSENDLAAPPSEEVDFHGANLDEGEEDDLYADLETSETIDLGETGHSHADSQSHDNASAKRSREEEDEWDFVDTNPDLKRRRPS